MTPNFDKVGGYEAAKNTMDSLFTLFQLGREEELRQKRLKETKDKKYIITLPNGDIIEKTARACMTTDFFGTYYNLRLFDKDDNVFYEHPGPVKVERKEGED